MFRTGLAIRTEPPPRDSELKLGCSGDSDPLSIELSQREPEIQFERNTVPFRPSGCVERENRSASQTFSLLLWIAQSCKGDWNGDQVYRACARSLSSRDTLCPSL